MSGRIYSWYNLFEEIREELDYKFINSPITYELGNYIQSFVKMKRNEFMANGRIYCPDECCYFIHDNREINPYYNIYDLNFKKQDTIFRCKVDPMVSFTLYNELNFEPEDVEIFKNCDDPINKTMVIDYINSILFRLRGLYSGETDDISARLIYEIDLVNSYKKDALKELVTTLMTYQNRDELLEYIRILEGFLREDGSINERIGS